MAPVLILFAVCCAVLAYAGAPHVVRYLWADGFLPMFLVCIVIPGTLWASGLAMKEWLSARRRRH